MVLLQVGLLFFSYVDDVLFHFPKFSLEDIKIYAPDELMLIDVSDPHGSFTHIPFVHTSSACVFRNLNYSIQLFCSPDVRFLAQVIEVAQ